MDKSNLQKKSFLICSPTGRIHKIREGEWLQVARKESWAITSQQKRVNKEDGSWVGYKFSNLVQVLYYPALFQNSIKQYHYLGTKCSDIQAYGSMFLFKTPQELNGTLQKHNAFEKRNNQNFWRLFDSGLALNYIDSYSPYTALLTSS